jgi:phosphoglycerate kinase
MKLRRWTSRQIRKGTRVLLRVDLNVSHKRESLRLFEACREIERLTALGARVAVITHRDYHCSTRDLLPLLKKRLGYAPLFVPDCVGQRVSRALHDARFGPAILLENVRFYKEEESDDTDFAQTLMEPFDIFINNAFGVCHRAHASVHAIAHVTRPYAGNLVVREIEELSRSFAKPFVLALGGVKLATKVPLLSYVGTKADKVLLGGGVAVTFLRAQKRDLPVEPASFLTTKPDLLAARKAAALIGQKIFLPTDFIVRKKDKTIIDIGEETRALFAREVSLARSVVWNGCMGMVEDTKGRRGTEDFFAALCAAKQARVVIGGGDTVEFVGLKAPSHIFLSTGGGAMLAFLAGEEMPGLSPLYRRGILEYLM